MTTSINRDFTPQILIRRKVKTTPTGEPVVENDKLPAGTIIWYAGDGMTLTSRSNYLWLVCDGSPMLTEEYPELFKVIKYTYGKPESDSLFLLPNLIGKTIIGAGKKYKLGSSTDGAIPKKMLNLTYDKKNRKVINDWFVAGRYYAYTESNTSNKWKGTKIASGAFSSNNSRVGGGVSGHNKPLYYDYHYYLDIEKLFNTNYLSEEYTGIIPNSIVMSPMIKSR